MGSAPGSAPLLAAAPPVDAAGLLARYADNPSAFLALNSQIITFAVPGIDGFIAYRQAGRRVRIQFGGVFASPGEQDRLLRAFLDDSRAARARVVAVQLVQSDAECFRRNGYRINQMGSSYALELSRFSLAGKHFVQLRNKISRARRAGVEVVEIGVDMPASAGLSAQLAAIDREWLESKGSGVQELAFLIGERGGPADPMRRLFVAVQDGRPIAYVSYSPVYGSRPGWLYDLSRRIPAAPPGVMELILATTVDRLRSETLSHTGVSVPGWLHFGFTPFTGLDPAHRISRAASRTIDAVVGALARYGNALYPAADQVAYKLKWQPHLVAPDYLAFHGRPRLSSVWGLLRLTRVI